MDIQLHAVEMGTGQPLVLLHGNGENSDYFHRQIAFFSQYYRVIAVDTRGHGRSERGTRPFTLEQFAEDLYDFLKSRRISRANILGFSDGGNIALLFAMKYPEQVDRLILNGANLNPYGLKLPVLLSIQRDWCSAAFRSLFDERYVHQKELLALMLAEPKIRKKAVRRVSAHTLVIAGSRDMIRNRHTKKIRRNLKNGRLIILEGTHFIASENNLEFNDAVHRFLEDTCTSKYYN